MIAKENRILLSLVFGISIENPSERFTDKTSLITGMFVSLIADCADINIISILLLIYY